MRSVFAYGISLQTAYLDLAYAVVGITQSRRIRFVSILVGKNGIVHGYLFRSRYRFVQVDGLFVVCCALVLNRREVRVGIHRPLGTHGIILRLDKLAGYSVVAVTCDRLLREFVVMFRFFVYVNYFSVLIQLALYAFAVFRNHRIVDVAGVVCVFFVLGGVYRVYVLSHLMLNLNNVAVPVVRIIIFFPVAGRNACDNALGVAVFVHGHRLLFVHVRAFQLSNQSAVFVVLVFVHGAVRHSNFGNVIFLVIIVVRRGVVALVPFFYNSTFFALSCGYNYIAFHGISVLVGLAVERAIALIFHVSYDHVIACIAYSAIVQGFFETVFIVAFARRYKRKVISFYHVRVPYLLSSRLSAVRVEARLVPHNHSVAVFRFGYIVHKLATA